MAEEAQDPYTMAELVACAVISARPVFPLHNDTNAHLALFP